MAEVSSCRICGSNLKDVFDMGVQAVASRFPAKDEADPPSAPLVLVKCQGECGLVQLKHTVSADEMYTHAYGYRSGLNESMRAHLKTVVDDLYKYVTVKDGDVVLDIGSNDGTLLFWHDKKATRVGIDPTGSQFKEYYDNDVTLVPDFFTYDTYSKALGERKARCVTTVSMFYDLPDPLQFMKDVAQILDPYGVWIMEQSYMPTMLETGSYDTICHEHLEYYCFKQIEWMTKRAGLRVVDVSLNDCNGGSFRVTLCHDSAPYPTNVDNVQKIIAKDSTADIEAFVVRSEKHRQDICALLQRLKDEGKSVYLYGASTKGNTMLQYCGIGSNFITSAAERNPMKFGCRTPNTGIPIVSEAEVRQAKPDYMLVLPWHFRSGFIEREREYLENGGKLIFPLPVIDIVSKSTHM
jgi:hypothetical protein